MTATAAIFVIQQTQTFREEPLSGGCAASAVSGHSSDNADAESQCQEKQNDEIPPFGQTC
jgi:hypothetical protein